LKKPDEAHQYLAELKTRCIKINVIFATEQNSTII